jgi:hypothetical protein
VAPRARLLPGHLIDRDFAHHQPLAWAAATVGRCLRLNAEHGAPLEAFRVALVSPSPLGLVGDSSGGGAFGRDVVGWVAGAVARGAREVQVDMAPPPPQEDADAAPLADRGTAALCLELPGDVFQARSSLERRAGQLATCGALESLTLRSCPLLTSVSVASGRLRVLELLGCRAVRELRVAAPALESGRPRLLQRDR